MSVSPRTAMPARRPAIPAVRGAGAEYAARARGLRSGLALGALLFVCSTQRACAAPYEEFHGRAMGTRYVVKVADRPPDLALDALATEVRAELARLEHIFSLFRTDSELSRFNAAAAETWIPVSPDLYAVVVRAQDLSLRTGGAFDPTVGPLFRLWQLREISADWAPPSPEAIQRVLQRVGMRRVAMRLEPPALRKQTAGVELDLNALVEGWAIDRLCEKLQSHGLRNLLVELGGEFRGLGRRGDGRTWRIGVEDPQRPTRCYATLELEQAALSTSGDYRQAVSYRGVAYSHILDPRTGSPIRHEGTAVSVLADDAFTADGWSTALLVLGPVAGPALAEREGLAASFVRRTPAGSAVQLTTVAAERFRLHTSAAVASTEQPLVARSGAWTLFGLLAIGMFGMLAGAWAFRRQMVLRRPIVVTGEAHADHRPPPADPAGASKSEAS